MQDRATASLPVSLLQTGVFGSLATSWPCGRYATWRVRSTSWSAELPHPCEALGMGESSADWHFSTHCSSVLVHTLIKMCLTACFQHSQACAGTTGLNCPSGRPRAPADLWLDYAYHNNSFLDSGNVEQTKGDVAGSYVEHVSDVMEKCEIKYLKIIPKSIHGTFYMLHMCLNVMWKEAVSHLGNAAGMEINGSEKSPFRKIEDNR